MKMLEAVKQAGVVGAGGAGFPAHIKLGATAEWFLVNAAECEPLIETDKYLCRSYPKQLVGAVVLIAEQLQARHAVIVLKKKYHREIAALEAAIAELKAPVELFLMDSFYPAGDEQIMVWQVTGRCVPERGLPLDVGCVVHNAGTVLAIADALAGKPVTDKYFSVTGAVKRPVIFQTPVGTAITEILAAAPLAISEYSVIVGGPMMGRMLMSEAEINAAVITKTTGNLLILPKAHPLFTRAALSTDRMKRQAQAACIRCRMCTDMCPRYLIGHEVLPNVVMRNAFRETSLSDQEEYRQCFKSAVNCCSCGICELFSCPMDLSPRRMNDYVKKRIREMGMEIAKNQHPKLRREAEYRKIPTERLIARLGLSAYVTSEEPEVKEFFPVSCYIPLSQHIGKPALPLVQTGSEVVKGALIGAAAKGLSANIHASIDGIVTEVTEKAIRISKEGE